MEVYEELLYEATDQYVEWLVIEDAKKSKKSNYAQNGYYTPLYWVIFDDCRAFKISHAIVLGRVLGYCQAERRQCDASTETIAKQCHLSVRTVKECLAGLEAQGYIDDITPNRRNAPHVYVDTGKLGKLRKNNEKSSAKFALE